ncbi:MAG: hypothetical protein JRE40_03355 [Deltaproteobacteria bacterium]|nr:hypothetical protein [Deltaproteobacteria bacterium]MBW2672981.1 hypothetical protein [Deltaproteobacteria bacterium]
MVTKPFDEFAGILERMDIDVEDTVEIERFREALADRLGYEPSDRQTEAFWQVNEAYWDMMERRGIRAWTVEYPWGRQTRFTIKGYRGFFGTEGVKRTTGLDLHRMWWEFL